jgi:hypothetical protein
MTVRPGRDDQWRGACNAIDYKSPVLRRLELGGLAMQLHDGAGDCPILIHDNS